MTISKKTRVLILTERDFKRYKNNQTFTYFGGVKEGSYDFTATKSEASVLATRKKLNNRKSVVLQYILISIT